MQNKARWTFMVYLAGDNNLETFGDADLGEMKKVGSNDSLKIIAQFDRMSDKVTRRYCLSDRPSLAADLVQELPEVNTGDPRALLDFIGWGVKNYRADRYALILWNHGTGWKDEDFYQVARLIAGAPPMGRGQERALRPGRGSRALFSTTVAQMVETAVEKAVLLDDTSADFLDNIEMKKVMTEVLSVTEGKPIDLLGFDACLMNMIEVAYQVRGTCSVMVGSQEIEPGEGWPYDDILGRLKANPGMGADELGKIIVGQYIDFYARHYPHLGVTQSAIDVERTGKLVKKLEALARLLQKGVARPATAGRVFDALRKSQSFRDRDYIDLGHFCKNLAASAPATRIGKAAFKVVEQIQPAAGREHSSPVIAEGRRGDGLKNAAGLSIYLPSRQLSSLYGRLDFAADTHWDDFLTAFVG